MNVPHAKHSSPDLPPDWHWVQLKKLVPGTQYGTSVSTEDDSGTPVIGMGDLRDGVANLDGLSRGPVSSDECNSLQVNRGDILFNRTNSLERVGKIGVVRDTPKETTVFASYLVRLLVNHEVADNGFVAACLNSNAAIARLRTLATPGVSQFNINPTSLRNDFWLPQPPVNVQRAIAVVAARTDAVLSGIAKQLQTLITRRAGLKQALLTGDRRFPEFIKSRGRKQTFRYDYPEDWDLKSVGSLASETNRKADQSDEITVLSSTKHNGLVDSLEYFGRQVYSDDTANYKLVERGQFAYATNHIEEGSIGLLSHREKGLVSPMYTVFETNGEAIAEYLYPLLKTDFYLHLFGAMTNGSVDRRGGLRWSDFRTIRVALPSKAEQQRIIELLSLIDQEITLLNRLRIAMHKRKRGIMKRLLFGEVSIPKDVVERLNYEAEMEKREGVAAAENTDQTGASNE